MSKILVYLEAHNEGLKRISYELITAARELVGAENVIGVIFDASESQIQTSGSYGLSKVLVIKNSSLTSYSSSAIASSISQVASAEGCNVVLFPANSHGLELAPRTAIKLDAGYISDCIWLDYNGGDIIASKPVYAGKAIIKTKIEKSYKVFALRPNIFTANEANSTSVSISDFSANISDKDLKVKIVGLSKNEGKLDVSEADKVVSGGRGLKGPENFYLVEDLAKSINGAVGASRAVVDAGWRPHGEQVGQTGKAVSPNLYIALAISGAVQHLAGMSSSKIIVAINKDKDAPIFKVADYGIVGDIFDVVPKLTAKINSLS